MRLIVSPRLPGNCGEWLDLLSPLLCRTLPVVHSIEHTLTAHQDKLTLIWTC
jgi:hypothetical protein